MRKVLIATVMIVTLTVGALAQRGRALGQGSGTPGQSGPLTGLKNALNLNDAQVSAIQALIQASQQQSKGIMSDLSQKRQNLNSLLNATSPNPTDVGNAAIAVNSLEKQLQAVRTTLLGNIRNTLIADQQQTFDTLVKAGLPIPGIGFGGPGPGGFRGPRGGQ